MRIAYVDESYNADFMFVACAVADESQWRAVTEGFHEIRQLNSHHSNHVDKPELHGHELMGGVGDWKPLRGKHWVATAIYERSLAVMRDAGVKVLVRGIDIRRLNARYSYPKPPYSLALQFCLERLNEYMQKQCASDAVRVVADEVHTQSQHVREFGDFKGEPEHPQAAKSRKRLWGILNTMLLPKSGVWSP